VERILADQSIRLLRLLRALMANPASLVAIKSGLFCSRTLAPHRYALRLIVEGEHLLEMATVEGKAFKS